MIMIEIYILASLSYIWHNGALLDLCPSYPGLTLSELYLSEQYLKITEYHVESISNSYPR